MIRTYSLLLRAARRLGFLVPGRQEAGQLQEHTFILHPVEEGQLCPCFILPVCFKAVRGLCALRTGCHCSVAAKLSNVALSSTSLQVTACPSSRPDALHLPTPFRATSPPHAGTVGLYRRPVAILDFASLYPSLYRAHNLCYSTLLHRDDAGRLPPEQLTVTPTGRED